jgi:hypothetical protein
VKYETRERDKKAAIELLNPTQDRYWEYARKVKEDFTSHRRSFDSTTPSRSSIAH